MVLKRRQRKLGENGKIASFCLKKSFVLFVFFFLWPAERDLLGERLPEQPLSLPFYFLEPTSLYMGSNISFQVFSVNGQPPPPVLWPTPKDKPHCSYQPVSTEERTDAIRIWYQRIDSSEKDQ